MRNIVFIGLLLLFSCKNSVEQNQEKAEDAVFRFNHVSKYSDSAKRMRFTKLDNGTIGLIDGAKIPINLIDPLRKNNIKNRKLYDTVTQTLWFQLNPSYNKVIAIYTN